MYFQIIINKVKYIENYSSYKNQVIATINILMNERIVHSLISNFHLEVVVVFFTQKNKNEVRIHPSFTIIQIKSKYYFSLCQLNESRVNFSCQFNLGLRWRRTIKPIRQLHSGVTYMKSFASQQKLGLETCASRSAHPAELREEGSKVSGPMAGQD